MSPLSRRNSASARNQSAWSLPCARPRARKKAYARVVMSSYGIVSKADDFSVGEGSSGEGGRICFSVLVMVAASWPFVLLRLTGLDTSRSFLRYLSHRSRQPHGVSRGSGVRPPRRVSRGPDRHSPFVSIRIFAGRRQISLTYHADQGARRLNDEADLVSATRAARDPPGQ